MQGFAKETSVYINEQKRLANFIEDSIQNNKQFLIARFSDIESRFVHSYLKNKINNSIKYQLENNAGIHIKSTESAKKYVQAVSFAFRDSSVHCIWDEGAMRNCMGESQDYVRSFSLQIPTIDALSLNPCLFLYNNIPYEQLWISKLKRKRILIISAFTDTMKQQIECGALSKIYNEPGHFADNTFVFVKAPLTLAGNHQGIDWEVRLDALKEAVQNAGEFDIALVSCGGYGMPICHYIYKELSRSAIYVGGVLQLFFGIYGGRWCHEPIEKKFIEGAETKEYWVRPSERPANLDRVESGCYW